MQEYWKGTQNCFSGIAIHTFALSRNSMEVEIGNFLNLNIALISEKKKGFFIQHFLLGYLP